MHKFTNVFSSSTPAEAGSGWPVTLNTSTDAALGSPVYDSASGNIFVSDYLINIASNCEPGVKTAEGLCGYLYAVNARDVYKRQPAGSAQPTAQLAREGRRAHIFHFVPAEDGRIQRRPIGNGCIAEELFHHPCGRERDDHAPWFFSGSRKAMGNAARAEH